MVIDTDMVIHSTVTDMDMDMDTVIHGMVGTI